MHVFDYIVRMGGKGQIEENTKGHQWQKNILD